MGKRSLHLAQDDAADRLLASDPFALLAGMLLDQQIPMERAFAGPHTLASRLGTPQRLDPVAIARHEPEAFAKLMATPPAVHRFPGSMAARVQALCRAVLSDWGGDAAAIWSRGDPDGREVLKRLKARLEEKLPGLPVQLSQKDRDPFSIR